MTLRATSLLSFLVVALAGCVATSTEGANAAVPEGQSEIAEVHKAHCGNCHVRVEPGTRTREQLNAAFSRHRKRVRLTEDEWAKMTDYLASPGLGATAGNQ